MTLEGSGGSRLLQAVRKYGKDSTQPTTITTATVTSTSPNFAIRVDGDSIDTPSEGLIIAEHLTEYTRTIQLDGGTEQTMTVKSPLAVDDPLIVAIANDGQLIYVLDKAVI